MTMPKISQLTAVVTPADADITVLVQGGTTKKVALSVLKTYFSGSDVQNNLAGSGAPGSGDDSGDGYAIGSVWIDTAASPREAYRCLDATEGAAIWVKETLDLSELGTMALLDGEAPTAENDVLMGGSSPISWVKKTLAQFKSILGFPDPTAESDFMVAAGSPVGWTKKTLAEAKTILGVGVATVPIGLLQGLVVSRKDNDEVYVSGGSVEVGGVLLNSDQRISLAAGGEPLGFGDVSASGTMTSSGDSAGRTAANTVDDSGDTYWDYYSFSYPVWLQHDAGSGETVNVAQYTMTPRYPNYMPTEWTFEGSNNGTDWVTLDTKTGESFAEGVKKTYTPSVAGAYRYHRWNITAGAAEIAMNEIELLAALYNLEASTPYYIYVDPPGSGVELAAGNLILSPTAPSWDSAKGGFYHPTNTDQRAIAWFETDESGYVPTIIYMYPPVADASKQDALPVPSAESDFLVAVGSPPEWTKMSLVDVKSLLGIS